jgi:predicted P-loop ATPase
MLLHAALCVGYDELDGMAKREQSTLKAMITCREDSFRKPYGATVDFYPRRSVLYGCGNNPAFLTEDHSGYRRYAIVKVPRLLDFDGLEREVGQLWAEAWEAYRTDALKYWEVEGASAVAEEYVVESATGAMLDIALEQLAERGHKEFQSLMLYQQMNMPNPNMGQIKEIANLLRSKGYVVKSKKVAGSPRKVWSRG